MNYEYKKILKPELLGLVYATIIVLIECIIIGVASIYFELKGRINERINYKVCEGIINDTKFKLSNSNWIKASILLCIVDGKGYETIAIFGINGIIGKR